MSAIIQQMLKEIHEYSHNVDYDLGLPSHAEHPAALERIVTKYLPTLVSPVSIQPGDTVTLKSGGPKMTVCEVTNREESDTAKCVYFPMGSTESPGHEVQILEVQVIVLTKVE